MDLNFYFYFLDLSNFFEICTNFKGFPMAQSQQHLEIIFLYLRESSKIKIALKIARKVKIDPLIQCLQYRVCTLLREKHLLKSGNNNCKCFRVWRM